MKKAIVLLNMGGPNNIEEVPLFLNNMFNDKNIITVKSDLLRSLIASMIVKFRGDEAKKNYALLGGKSPLKDYTKTLIAKLQAIYPDTYITYAMRYTPTFVNVVVDELKDKGIQEITLLPLYPHYSTTTTKSSVEDFKDELARYQKEYTPNVHTVHNFYENTRYNQSVINSIKDTVGKDKSEDFHLIFSAHSLPQKIIDAGDPYQSEVIENVGIIKYMLKQANISFASISLAYQSKLGPVKWLEPNLEEQLHHYKRQRVIIYPISFILDNSETEVELDIEYRHVAKKHCIKEYRVCRCIGERDDFIDVIKEII